MVLEPANPPSGPPFCQLFPRLTQTACVCCLLFFMWQNQAVLSLYYLGHLAYSSHTICENGFVFITRRSCSLLASWSDLSRLGGLVLLFLSCVFLLCALFLFFWRPFSVSPPGFRPVGEIRMINHNGLGKISVCRMHRWGPHPESPLQEFQSLAWTVGSECTR